MVMGRLRYCRPQHQGQAEPRQPSTSKPHTFLHWARFSFDYNGCLAQGNAGQVTMGTECYVVPSGCVGSYQTLQARKGMSEPTYEELKARLSQLEKEVETK